MSDLDQSPALPFDLIARGPTDGFVKDYSGGSVTNPGGADTNVQFNNSGVFGGLTDVQLTARIQAFSSSLSGAVPASGGGTTNFLRADGTFAVPVSGGVTDGDKGDITVSNSGALWTIDLAAVTYAKIQNVFNGRLLGRFTASPGTVEEITGTQVTTLLDAFTSSLKGLVPASGGGTANFLRADGTFAAPPGSVPGGSNTQLQYNSSGGFGGAANLLYDSATGRFTVGGFVPQAVGGKTPDLTVFDGSNQWNYSAIAYNSHPANVMFARTNGASPTTFTTVATNQSLTEIDFFGAEGTALALAATLIVRVAGSVAAGSVPSRYEFYTNSVGNTSPTDRMHLAATGELALLGSQSFRCYNLGDELSGNSERGTFDFSTTSNVLTIGTQKNGTGTLRDFEIVKGTDVFFSSEILTVATLPTVGVKGRRRFVSDANATTFQSVVAGGGSNNVPVFDDGTQWRIG